MSKQRSGSEKVGDDYEQTLLTWADGSRVAGRVLGLSNSGYAVGSLASGQGFIWHPTFDEPQLFDDWLANQEGGVTLPTPSTAVVGVVEDVANNKLAFSVNGGAYFVQVDLNETDEPNVNVVSFSEGVIAVGQGYDPSTDTTYIVGQLTTDGEVEQIVASSQGLGEFSSEVLAGLPGFSETTVSDISSDGSSISGFTQQLWTDPNNFQGLFWDSNDPSSVAEIGSLLSDRPTSQGLGAFKGGAVGQQGGSADAIVYTDDGGLIALEDGLNTSVADCSFTRWCSIVVGLY